LCYEQASSDQASSKEGGADGGPRELRARGNEGRVGNHEDEREGEAAGRA